MWKPGNLITIQERIPMDGSFLVVSTKCRVIHNSGCHRCLNCPMQQKYCNIDKCEKMLPQNCTLIKAQTDPEQVVDLN